jgi:ATP-dependent Clp protease ATP-binding subunit ClpA
MDHATLTDNNGKKADFRNVILIMTTNAGAREMTSEDIGFRLAEAKPAKLEGEPKGESKSRAEPNKIGITKGKDAIERTFSPEFRNRLDAWIIFNALSHSEIVRVVDKFVNEVRAQLIEKNVELVLADSAREWLSRKSFDKLYGARPMARLIQEKIKEPLAEELLFGTLELGGKVVVLAEDDELKLSSSSLDDNSIVVREQVDLPESKSGD